MSEQSNIMFEKFEIISCIQKDACAAVYKAHHIYLDKQILLKTLDKNTCPDPSILERFKREAKLLAKLDHQHIIKVLDFGTFDHHFYISFEYFKSKNLREKFKENLNDEQKESIFNQILLGLGYAHENNIIHRDLKPENILVDSNWHVKIADFGLAQSEQDSLVTHKSSIVGTPGYMSPEQVRGGHLSLATDLFSLGILGLELFSGTNPFLSKDIGETLNNIQRADKIVTAEFLENVPEIYREHIAKMLKPERERPTIGFLINEFGLHQQHHSSFKSQKNFKWRPVAAMFVVLILVFVLVLNRNFPENPLGKDSLVNSAVPTEIDSIIHDKNEPETRSNPKFATENSNEKIAETGKLFVLCSPWARVFIDEKFIDTTPIEEPLTVKRGEHQLLLKNPGYPDFHKEFIIQDSLTTIKVNLDTMFAWLDCKVFPWADVYVNKRLAGQTPFENSVPVLAGEHKLTFKNPNYADVVKVVNFTRKDTTLIKFNFNNRPAMSKN